MSRKDEIRSAVERIVAEYGARGVTTARIAAEVGVSDAAIFKHYRSMEMLLSATVEEASRAVLDLVPGQSSGPVLDRIAGFLQSIFDLLDSRPGYYRLLFQTDLVVDSHRLAGKLKHIATRLHAEMKALILDAVGHGALRADTDPDRLAQALFGCVHAAYFDHAVLGRTDSMKRSGMAMARLTIQGSLT